jgi:hypothetical protein
MSDEIEPTGFGIVRQNAISAFGLAFSPAEMRDAHDLVEENAWAHPAFRSEDTWYLEPATQTVVTWETDRTLAIPAAAGRIALALHRLGSEDVFLPSRRCLVRLLVAHITGRPPVDAPTPEEAARRAALVAEIAGRRAAEAERRRRATEVWVRVVRGGTGYRGTSIQIVGTLQDMENRRGEEDGIVDPMAEGLRTAHQLCGGRGVTNAQLFRLVQIRDDLEMEYDARLWRRRRAALALAY